MNGSLAKLKRRDIVRAVGVEAADEIERMSQVQNLVLLPAMNSLQGIVHSQDQRLDALEAHTLRAKLLRLRRWYRWWIA